MKWSIHVGDAFISVPAQTQRFIFTFQRQPLALSSLFLVSIRLAAGSSVCRQVEMSLPAFWIPIDVRILSSLLVTLWRIPWWTTRILPTKWVKRFFCFIVSDLFASLFSPSSIPAGRRGAKSDLLELRWPTQRRRLPRFRMSIKIKTAMKWWTIAITPTMR